MKPTKEHASTEAGKVTVLRAKPPNAFLPPNAGVKPPHGGVATACSVAQARWLTPRCGVGLNDLLGAKEAGKSETLAQLPKLKWESPDAHPRTSRRTSTKRLRQLWEK